MAIDNPHTNPASLWEQKPWWCQPWSILLTGVAAVAISQWWPHRLWFTIFSALIVMAWWGLFLVLAPAAYRQELQSAERDPGQPNAQDSGEGLRS